VDLQSRGLLAGLEVVGPARAAAAVPGLTRAVDEGDRVVIGNVEGRVMLTEGHLNGHVSFVFGDAVFCGDTLFAGGCGYLFDGPPETMWDSLTRLGALDPATRVCCAHEYTHANFCFAAHVLTEHVGIRDRLADLEQERMPSGSSVPDTLARELETNPFLLALDPHHRRTLARVLNVPNDDAASVLGALRSAKDSF